MPQSLPNPRGAEHKRPALRRYEDSAFLFLGDRVYAIILTGSDVETAQGVGIGDSIDELRGSYDDAECKGVAGDESLTGGINTSYPSCRVQAASTRSVVFGGDPIRSITFYSNAPLG